MFRAAHHLQSIDQTAEGDERRLDFRIGQSDQLPRLRRDLLRARLIAAERALAVEDLPTRDPVGARDLFGFGERHVMTPIHSRLGADDPPERVAYFGVIPREVDGDAREPEQTDSIVRRQRVNELRRRLERRLLLTRPNALEVDGENDDAPGLDARIRDKG